MYEPCFSASQRADVHEDQPAKQPSDDEFWDAFPLDDEQELLPDQGDFWVEPDQLGPPLFAA